MANETGGGGVLDPEAIENLRSLGDGDLVREIGALFRTDSVKTVAEIREAIAKGDAEGAGKIAHRLKSSSVYLGARFVTELASKIERAGKEGDLASCSQHVAPLEREVLRAIAAVSKLGA